MTDDKEQDCCGNCVYWHDGEEDWGECRINPPVVVPVQLWCAGRHENDAWELKIAAETRFPNTDELEWCGRFKGRPQ